MANKLVSRPSLLSPNGRIQPPHYGSPFSSLLCLHLTPNAAGWLAEMRGYTTLPTYALHCCTFTQIQTAPFSPPSLFCRDCVGCGRGRTGLGIPSCLGFLYSSAVPTGLGGRTGSRSTDGWMSRKGRRWWSPCPVVSFNAVPLYAIARCCRR